MAKKSSSKGGNFFGIPDEIPQAVNVDDMTAPQFDRPPDAAEEIDYEEVDSGNDSLAAELDEMLNLDGIAKEAEESLEEEEAAAGGSPAPSDDLPAADEKVSDEAKSEMVILSLEGARQELYMHLYNMLVKAKDVKTIKSIARQLSRKQNRTAEESELMERMFNALDEHENLQKEYLESISISERRREIYIKLMEIELRRRRLMGKKDLTNMIIFGSILFDEGKSISRLFTHKMRKPDLDTIDWAMLERSGIQL